MTKIDPNSKLIGVFYDGDFFARVSGYYNHGHERRARITFSGMHAYIRADLAKEEDSAAKYCQIDAHYYRGRARASEAGSRDLLLVERQFDDVLLREGVKPHYWPFGHGGDKGADVMLTLDAYEMSVQNKYDVVVLVTGDGNFLPLVRRLKSRGVRVMVMGWNFKSIDAAGQERDAVTSVSLLEESTYPRLMSKIIDEDPNGAAAMLFAKASDDPSGASPGTAAAGDVDLGEELLEGEVFVIKEAQGYGFIRRSGTNQSVFFHASVVMGDGFDQLAVGERVQMVLGRTDRGVAATRVSKCAEPMGALG